MEEKVRTFFSDKINRTVVISTILFALAAHLYRWMNPLFSHDALMILQNDGFWQISLGRYLMPVYVFFRGKITSPWLIGFLSLIYLCGAMLLIVRILNFRSLYSVIGLCGIMSTFYVYAVANASFLPWVDIYMLSLFFSAATVYFFVKYDWGWIPGAFLGMFSLGLYQSYIQVAVVLTLIWFIRQCILYPDLKKLAKKACMAVLFFLLAGLLYYAGLKIALSINDLSPTRTQNSIAVMEDLTNYDLPALIRGSIASFFARLSRPLTFHPRISGLCNLALGLLALIPCIHILIKSKLRVLIILLILLFPLAANFVYVLSRGYYTDLMVYSLPLYYALILSMYEYRAVLVPDKPGPTFRNLEKLAVGGLFFVLMASNVIYSNEIYLKKALEEQSTLSVMTRVVDGMEKTEGFVPWTTRVCLYGDINFSTISMERPGFTYPEMKAFGLSLNYAMTHYMSYVNYFRFILGYPIEIVSEEEIWKFAENPEVLEMPAFPSEGFCKVIDDVIVVKLSPEMSLYTKREMNIKE